MALDRDELMQEETCNVARTVAKIAVELPAGRLPAVQPRLLRPPPEWKPSDEPVVCIARRQTGIWSARLGWRLWRLSQSVRRHVFCAVPYILLEKSRADFYWVLVNLFAFQWTIRSFPVVPDGDDCRVVYRHSIVCACCESDSIGI